MSYDFNQSLVQYIFYFSPMKKVCLLIFALLTSFLVFAQDNKTAYNAGKAVGRILPFIVLAALFVWLSLRLYKKNKGK
jgi:hypothetical protein